MRGAYLISESFGDIAMIGEKVGEVEFKSVVVNA